MKIDFSKTTNEQLLQAFENECKSLCYVSSATDKGMVYKAKLKLEILRRMSCYQYAIKPLNKKLYNKIRIQL